MKKILLIDGNSLLFRAYYATVYGSYGSAGTIMKAKDGTPTNAIFALATIMTKLMNETPPDYALVAFDSAEPTFRHLAFPNYKAGRKETPLELQTQFPLAIEMLNKMGIMTYKCSGIEADDIIGSAAKMARKNQLEVEIFSGDRDLLQLIDEHVTVKLTKKGLSELQIMDREALFKEWELEPQQIIDLKALMGDPSDNIPGISGVGEKTALKLLKEHKSIEQVLEANIPGKLGEKIKQSHEVAMMSKQLATIDCDLSLPFSLIDLEYKGAKSEELLSFYQRYDMNSLMKKIPIRQETIALDYELVTAIPEEYLSEDCSLILEFEQENYHISNIVGAAFHVRNKTFFLTWENVLKQKSLLTYLENPNYKKHGYDLKSYIVAFHRYQVKLSGGDFDLILATYLLQPSLKEEEAIIYDYYGCSVDYRSSIYTKKGYELDKVVSYACQKAMQLEICRKEALLRLTAQESLSLYQEIELPLASVLAQMEIQGVKVDAKILAEKNEEVQKKIDQLKQEIYQLAESEFNINSPSQMAAILYDKLNLPARNHRSTSAEELELLRPFHPIVDKLLNYRRYSKLQNTYLQALPQYILEDGKIHTIFNQALTQTGRLSSKEPNLQNISVRDEESREVRKAFVASHKGWYILSFDYSQIELRVLAHIANATSMIDAFNQGIDIHTATACTIFNVTKDQVTSQMRRQAKTINFGIIYGMSEWGLKEELGISVKEAKDFIERYFASYKEIKEYFDKTIEECKKNGYVKTYFNRIRYVKEINDANYNVREFGKRIAMNSPIQGTAADIIKKAMLSIAEGLKTQRYQTRMILQIHDELVFEVPFEELMSVIPFIQSTMEDVVNFKVNMVANYGYGYNWYDAK